VNQNVNRRRFERFALSPMYTPVAVRTLPEGTPGLDGHAYDISEGGLRFELDAPIAPGTPVIIDITLPPGTAGIEPKPVSALANVVWLDTDPDEPGPVRMAAVFKRFVAPADKDRLLGHLASGRFSRAA
jgi:hypothetical protein